jgi:hypothetical protein
MQMPNENVKINKNKNQQQKTNNHHTFDWFVFESEHETQ